MNKYTEAIQRDDVVILCDGIPMGVGEILAALNAATPPADAVMADPRDQWDIEELLCDAEDFLLCSGCSNEYDAVVELRRRVTTIRARQAAAVPDVFDGWEITCGGAYKNGHYSVVKRIDGKGWNGSAILNDELVSVVDAVPLDTAIIQCNRHAAILAAKVKP